jgi:transposase InsO family protein
MPNGAQRRLAVVHLYFEGWNIASIAGYLETTRSRVYEILHRFFAEDFAGLPDKSHAPKQPARKADFRAMAAIRRLQANPELGEFRVHAALRQMGIDLSPRTCGRILALNRTLGLPHPADPLPHERQPMPFTASYRHEYWSVDVRYIEKHQLADPKPVYVISVLDNYSRALLASVVSPRQDLTAYLLVLHAALREHGSPMGIVSDGGSIFKAHQVRRIYRELGIERYQIEPGAPWQNYIETHFNVMRRMADHEYAAARTWNALRVAHDHFFHDYNHQAHLAHQRRQDGKRSPSEVLGWVRGVWCDEAELDRLFRLRSERVFDRGGYVRFRRWRVYGERGLAGQRGAVWLSGEVLTVAYEEEALTQYAVAYASETRRIATLTDARLFPTRYPSPQPFLPGLGEVASLLAMPLRPYAVRRSLNAINAQLQLPI